MHRSSQADKLHNHQYFDTSSMKPTGPDQSLNILTNTLLLTKLIQIRGIQKTAEMV